MRRVTHRAGWAVSGAIALALLLALARVIQAGPLDPPGPVGSTMRTLNDLLPSWNLTLSSTGGCGSERWACVLEKTGVLDHETGLVWEQAPSVAVSNWYDARVACAGATIGNRNGWRLPTFEEFSTLREGAGGLPSGAPFAGAGKDKFWSSTTDGEHSDRVLVASLGDAAIAPKTESTLRHWCVRGPGGNDAAATGGETSWSRELPASGGCASERFSCVLGGDAVLDRDTGLVWERNPPATQVTYGEAVDECAISFDTPGFSGGWRVPTVDELATLLDRSSVLPALPAGHPFGGAAASTTFFWTSTVVPTGGLFGVTFYTGSLAHLVTSGTAARWCVRGPGG